MNFTPYLEFVFTAQLMHMLQLECEIILYTLARIKALPVFCSSFRDCKIFFCTLPVIVNHRVSREELNYHREERGDFFLKSFFYELDDSVGGLGKKLNTLNLSLPR
jgi:hypothetical protein